jgi:hypothetical protein
MTRPSNCESSMVEPPTEIKIFYSWQSDLPDSTNRGALRQALRAAATMVEEEVGGVRLSIDEATRDRPGSPNIPATILDKIDNSDIMVADVSIVNTQNPGRPCPNPNVVFELGYAVAHLGWGRIIMIFNENFGKLNDLPFDFDRHRVSQYTLAVGSTASDKKRVSSLLNQALFAIIKSAPKRPLDTRTPSPEQVRQKRNTDNVKRALSTIHIPSLEIHSEEDALRILDVVEYCWGDFDAVVRSSQFYIDDKNLDTTLRALHDAWGRSMMYPLEYHVNSNHTQYIFMRYDDPFYMAENDHQKHWDEMSAARDETGKRLRELLKIVHEQYLEIDVRELSLARWKEYQEWRKKLEA